MRSNSCFRFSNRLGMPLTGQKWNDNIIGGQLPAVPAALDDALP